MTIMAGSTAADQKYSPGAGADSLDLSHKQETESELGKGWAFETFKSTYSDPAPRKSCPQLQGDGV